MNKKGFTLIELLAVIVILAVIALIVTPIVTGIISEAKDSANARSVEGHIKNIEYQLIQKGFKDGNGNLPSGTYESFSDFGFTNYPTNDNVRCTNYVVSNGTVVSAEKCKDSTWVKEYSYIQGENVAIPGPTMVAALDGETHKGIVYLDPTNLSKTCNASNSVSTTETKIGCMKWYIFDDSGNEYKLLLDHNTTPRIRWDDGKKNVAYEDSNLYEVVQDLKTTSGWVVEPRIISADEVSDIVGKTSTWSSTSSSTWFYFEGTGSNNQTIPTYSDTITSKYDWLYNNVNKCKSDSTNYGCTIEDLNTYSGYGTAGEGNTGGYWTSTPVGTAGAGTTMWYVARNGSLNYYDAYNTAGGGIRPVITISKDIVK